MTSTFASLACLAAAGVLALVDPGHQPIRRSLAAIIICTPPKDGVQTCRVIFDPVDPVETDT